MIVDLSDPTRAVTPTLDGPVLAVLAKAGRPLTVGQIAELAARGSEIGIRRSVMRLVNEGLVTGTQMGRNQVHELNRQHVAAKAALALADLRLDLWNNFRNTLAAWVERPKYACVFGSAARGDGGPDSDIDLLIVHRPFPGEDPPKSTKFGLESLLSSSAVPSPDPPPNVKAWNFSVDTLYGSVQRWTGNLLHLVDLPTWQWLTLEKTDPGLLDEIKRDSITVAGDAKCFPYLPPLKLP